MGLVLIDTVLAAELMAAASGKHLCADCSFGDVAAEGLEVWNALADINCQLALIGDQRTDQSCGHELDSLVSFLNLPLAKQIAQIIEAGLQRRHSKLVNFLASNTDQVALYVELLAACRDRFRAFFGVVRNKAESHDFLKELIDAFEASENFSEVYDKLFNEALGLSNIGGIENALAPSQQQRIWKGAATGRYAYASSLGRMSRFYRNVPLTSESVVYDLGCGYGHALFYGALKFPSAAFKGVEYIAERVEAGRAVCERLGFSNISLFAGDARLFDFSDGNVFYLYSPFTRDIKQEVFHALVELGRKKKIRLFVYDTDQLNVFQSFPDVFRDIGEVPGEVFESR